MEKYQLLSSSLKSLPTYNVVDEPPCINCNGHTLPRTPSDSFVCWFHCHYKSRCLRPTFDLSKLCWRHRGCFGDESVAGVQNEREILLLSAPFRYFRNEEVPEKGDHHDAIRNLRMHHDFIGPDFE